MARVALAAGDRAAFQQHWAEAHRIGKTLTDKEDSDVLYADLNESKERAGHGK